MAQLSPRGSFGRAIIAVIALYGFLLQGTLAGWAPPGPVLSDQGMELCSPRNGDHAPAPVKHHGGQECCTAAYVGFALAPPARAVIVTYDAEAVGLIWPGEAILAPSDPKPGSASARGPPLA